MTLRLPKFFPSIPPDDIEDSKDICAICRGSMARLGEDRCDGGEAKKVRSYVIVSPFMTHSDRAVKLPCNHIFGKGCLELAFQKTTQRPLCRYDCRLDRTKCTRDSRLYISRSINAPWLCRPPNRTIIFENKNARAGFLFRLLDCLFGVLWVLTLYMLASTFVDCMGIPRIDTLPICFLR